MVIQDEEMTMFSIRSILPACVLALLIIPPKLSFADVFEHTVWSDGLIHYQENAAWESPGNASCIGIDRVQISIIPENDIILKQAATYDLDEDGDIDVIYAATYGNESYLIWAENDDQGDSWSAYYIYEAPQYPKRFAFGDFDLDDRIDIAVFFAGTREIYWFGSPDGVVWYMHYVGKPAALSSCMGICAADFNADGFDDIISAQYYGISYWRNEHLSGIFVEEPMSIDIPGQVDRLYTVDLEPDDDTDLIAICTAGLCVLRNSSLAYPDFTPEPIPGSSDPDIGLICDFDEDGDTDIVTGDNGISWFENLGSGQWQYHHVADVPVGMLSVGDFDDDAIAEIVCTSSATSHPSPIYLWDMTAPDTWSSSYYMSYLHDSECITAGDINGDGVPDTVIERVWTEGNAQPADSAYLVPSFFGTTPDVEWGFIDWVADTPLDSRVQFRIRTWDLYSSPSSWSDPIMTPGTPLAGYVADPDDSFIQYMAELIKGTSGAIPTIDSVSITFTPLGIEEYLEGVIGFSVQPLSNPCVWEAVLRIELQEAGTIFLNVFDISGRLVVSLCEQYSKPGLQEYSIRDLRPGVYFLRAEMGSETCFTRFAVIR